MIRNIYIYLALSYLLIVTDGVRCKPDYLFNDLAGGWLKVHKIPATWQEAFLRCHYEGAVLASPLNKQLADALNTLVTQSVMHGQIFLGTHDLFSKGDFVSIEGVPLSDMQITWGVRGTNLDNANCLTMTPGGVANLMYFSPCTDSLPYICYRKLDNLTMNECGTFDNEYHLNQRTGSCYKVHQEKQTWPSAYRICASEGGYLVILNDREEARIVKDMFPVRAGEVNLWERFHIGLLAWGDDRTWTTIHGERIEDVFHDWNPGQPDNHKGVQDHAAFLRAGTLDDDTPTSRAMFVCEKSPDSIRFEASPLGIDESNSLKSIRIEQSAHSESTDDPKPQKPRVEFSDFGDGACGEPAFEEQLIVLDFTPDAEIDNEISQKKICDFWKFINNTPYIKNLMVKPERCDMTEPSAAADAPEVVKEEPEENFVSMAKTACSMLEIIEEKELISRAFEGKMHQSHCCLGSGEYKENKDMRQKTRANRVPVICRCTKICKPCPVKKPSEAPLSKAKQLCTTLQDWDDKHPKSMEPPGHPPVLQHCIIQRQVFDS